MAYRGKKRYGVELTMCDGERKWTRYETPGKACKAFYEALVKPVQGDNERPEAKPHVRMARWLVQSDKDGTYIHQVLNGPFECACKREPIELDLAVAKP